MLYLTYIFIKFYGIIYVKIQKNNTYNANYFHDEIIRNAFPRLIEDNAV